MSLETDSLEYETTINAAMAVKDVEGLSLEIGLRRGGGSFYLMEAYKISGQDRPHIAIDPYGDLEYRMSDTVGPVRIDYTDEMRNICMKELWELAHEKGYNFLFFQLDDEEYFRRFADGVPIYAQTKKIFDKYALVVFDGPHDTESVVREYEFFRSRVNVGSILIFDDIADYDHARVEKMLFDDGFEIFEKGERKGAYRKK